MQPEIETYLQELPESAPLRQEHPNLRPVDTPMERKKTLTRKKPPGGVPEPPALETPEPPPSEAQQEPYWKYHVQHYGRDLYLTTNPTLRHLHCRNAPGYFVSIDGSAVDYTMSFEDLDTGEQILRVRRMGAKNGTTFRYKVKLLRAVALGHIAATAPGAVFEGHLQREPIPPALLPVPPVVPMSNYAGPAPDGQTWHVGLVPRVRESRLGAHELRYVGKENVHFHGAFRDVARYREWAIPPVVAVYRPQASAKKRVLRRLGRLLREPGTMRAEPGTVRALGPYLDVRRHHRCGDGLYLDANPADDEPDDKVGWLTVYDGPELATPGMLDLVVGLTVAVGYDRSINY